MAATTTATSRLAPVNGIELAYQIQGSGAHSTQFAHSVHAEFARSFRGFSPTLGGRASGRREASARPLDHHLLLCV